MKTLPKESLIRKLFDKPLPSARSGAYYNAFSYPTKISPESIAVYIASMTQPGDVVLDTFNGSGSTGVAALLCEHPTAYMKKLASELGVSPIWGARNAIGYEIGTYGAFATKTISSRLKAKNFKDAVQDYIKKAKETLSHYYLTKDPLGREGEVRYIIWSEILLCPFCQKEVSFFDNGIKRNPIQFKKEIVCPHCFNISLVDEMQFQKEEYYDELMGKICVRKKRIPAWIYGSTNGKNWDRRATYEDLVQIRGIEKELCHLKELPKLIQWGELHRNGYHYGITHLHQFYTSRNFIVMCKLWNAANEYSNEIKNALRLLLLSYNASHCTLMTRVVAKKKSKDFVLTGAQSGVLYISKLPVEKNIILGLERKAKPLFEVYKMLENCTGKFIVKNKSSLKLDEQDKSVDFVFTDPPFGDFIPYAEVNQINELWLEKTTNRAKEIIISSSQKKGVDDYQKMLSSVFSEVRRVLKETSSAAVVFHAAKSEVWRAFESAITDAGLNTELTNILEKKQASFKQVVSEDSVQGDPLLLLSKKQKTCKSSKNECEIIEKIVKSMNGRDNIDERRVYSLYVNECLKNKIQINHGAKEAYSLIRQIKKRIVDA